MSYGDIQWLPLTAGLTVLGLLLSYVIYRRSGARPALRAVAVSLLPIAAYLTGATAMLWKIGTAIGQFGTGFAFSTTKWIGVGVTGLAIALFLAAGGRARRKASKEARRAAQGKQDESAVESGVGRHDALTGARTPATRAVATTQTPVPATRKPAAAPAKASRKAAPADDDDLKDIEDILRKRGI